MKQDFETILEDVLSIMTSGLNTKIAAIEAEKVAAGKGITGGLASIDSNAYFEQTFDTKMLNYSPAIFYGIEDVAATGLGPATVEVITLFVECVASDIGDGAMLKRIHRYTRALKELFQENFSALENKVKIQTVRPSSFKLDLDSSEEIKVGGISIQLAIA